MMKQEQSLRATLLTPSGRGAVATVRVEGPDACRRVGLFFTAASGRSMDDLSADRIAVGRFRLGEEIADEVVVRKPAADAAEIHCHGGPEVARRLIEVLLADGGRQVSWKEWVRSAHASPIRAAAHIALAEAPTLRTASVLVDQLGGALDRAIEEALTLLDRHDLAGTQALLKRLLAHGSCGRHLIRPWRVVLAGRPNVGKSSLINALVGYQRVIVHETPGTTRDAVTTTTVMDGWPIELCDTAGLRSGGDPLEQEGIDRARRRLESADLVLVVVDASAPRTDEDHWLRKQYPRALIVCNKIDLLPSLGDRPCEGLAVSALTAAGIDSVIESIVTKLVPEPPGPGQAVPFSDQQIQLLLDACESLERSDLEGTRVRLRKLVR